MQKRKIDDSKIWEAYHRLMSGESLTKVASSPDINLDRGTLRKYIEDVVWPSLEESQRTEFKQVMSGNFRGNSTEKKREKRNGKKARAEQELNGKLDEILKQYGITAQQFETLYQRLRADKHTTCSRDTYVHKWGEHMAFFRSIGFTVEEVFEFFMRKPRAFGTDTASAEERFADLARRKGSREKAIEALRKPTKTMNLRADLERGEE